MVTKLSTGVEALDRRLNGGLSPGDVVAIVTSPATQSHVLISELMRERTTLYISTLRSATAVEGDFEIIDTDVLVRDVAKGASMDNEFMHELTGSRTFSAKSLTDDGLLDEVYESIMPINGEGNVVIDPMNPLERTDNRRAYQEVLDELKTRMLDSGGVGLLHCITHRDPPPFRETTLMIADVVWELDLKTVANGDIEFQLRVPKNRSGSAILEEVSLKINKNRVHVDDSRNI